MLNVRLLQDINYREAVEANIRTKNNIHTVTFDGHELDAFVSVFGEYEHAKPHDFDSFIIEVFRGRGRAFVKVQDRVFSFLDRDRSQLILLKTDTQNNIISRDEYTPKEFRVGDRLEILETFISPYRFTIASERINIHELNTFSYAVDNHALLNFSGKMEYRTTNDNVVVEKDNMKAVVRIDSTDDLTTNPWVGLVLIFGILIVAFIFNVVRI